jgi:potassium efflux system protein
LSIVKIDSNFQSFSRDIDSLGHYISNDTLNISKSRINNLLKEWDSYSEKLKSWQVEIVEHTREVEILIDSIHAKRAIWEQTMLTTEEKKSPKEIIARINAAIDSIDSKKAKLKEIDNWLIVAQDKLIGAQLNINEVIKSLKKRSQQYMGSLFVLDSEPIWQWNPFEESHDFWKELQTSYSDQRRILFIFFDEYSWQFAWHFLMFLGLIWLFNFMKRKYRDTDFPRDDHRIMLAKTTISFPNISALIFGLMISIYYYQEAPRVVFSLLTIFVSIPAIILFPKFVTASNRKFLVVIVAVYIFQELQKLIIVDPLLNRFSQILKAGLLIWVLYEAIKNQKIKKDRLSNHYWNLLIKYFAPLLLLISSLSIVSNIFGVYQLSEVLVSGAINASIYAIIFMVYGILIASIFIILLRSKRASSFQKITKDNAKFEWRISGIIYLYMMYLWIRSVLSGFKLLDPLIQLYYEFVSLYWIIGGVKLSIGGILSFIAILVVTFFLARIVKELISDKIIPVRSSARGLPNAFSMVIRYMIVTIGVYIALSAAGINLSEFGLVAGALGVGLGFGLQNILHNLVSGLIVSFERPVHVGDTVEVDQLQGVITEIGVRSSKIRTFDGSEVILPNGNLLSNQVINWTLTDQKRRLEIKVRTNFDANPREVIEILNKEKEYLPDKRIMIFTIFSYF